MKEMPVAEIQIASQVKLPDSEATYTVLAKKETDKTVTFLLENNYYQTQATQRFFKTATLCVIAD
jgi:hypothetical protein